MKTSTFRIPLFFTSPLVLVALAGCHGKLSLASTDGGVFSNANQVKQDKSVSGSADGAAKLRCETSFGSIDCKSEGDKVAVKAEVSASGKQPKEELTSWLTKVSVMLRRDGSMLIVELKKPEGMPR